jgi:hypothetical protein
MKTTHTPGPWHVYQPKGRAPEIRAPHVFIARVDDGETVSHEEGHANARLIASAPELLEALHELLSDYESTLSAYNDYRECSDGMSRVPEDESATKARATIAKATGSEVGE